MEMGGPVPGDVPGGGPPGGGPPVDPCNSPACVGAKAELAAARSDFTKDCDGLKYIKNWLDLLKPILTNRWIIALLIIALVLGLLSLWFFAIILWILILLYVVCWFIYLGLAR